MQPKKVAAVAAGSLLLLAGAFSAGRFLTPAKVVERVVTETRTVEKLIVDEESIRELKEQNREFREQLSEMKKAIHRETRTTKYADGREETIKVEDINVSKVVTEQTVKYVDREVKTTETRYVDRTVDVHHTIEKTKTVEAAKPDWRVGAVVGVNLSDITKPVYGGLVERRIIGPVSVVGMGLSNGTASIGVTMEF